MADTITWRPSADTRQWLAGRAERSSDPTGLSARTSTEIGLWRIALKAELALQHWSMDDLQAIATANRDALIPDTIATSIPRVAAAVIDTHRLSHPLNPLPHPDIDDLITRLLRLTPTADHALADAICQWWNTNADHTPQAWTNLGITPTT